MKIGGGRLLSSECLICNLYCNKDSTYFSLKKLTLSWLSITPFGLPEVPDYVCVDWEVKIERGGRIGKSYR